MPNPVIVAQAAAVAAPIVADVFKKAQSEAAKAVKIAIKALKCKLYPCRCEIQKRNARYLATFVTLVEEAKASADGGDFVTAYALATAAGSLDQVQPFAGYLTSSGSKPPNCTWTTAAATMATNGIYADALADGFEANAERQLGRGEGGTHRARPAGGISPVLIGGALLLGALVLAGARKSKRAGNGGGGSNGE
jgi:hypothetical protein